MRVRSRFSVIVGASCLLLYLRVPTVPCLVSRVRSLSLHCSPNSLTSGDRGVGGAIESVGRRCDGSSHKYLPNTKRNHYIYCVREKKCPCKLLNLYVFLLILVDIGTVGLFMCSQNKCNKDTNLSSHLSILCLFTGMSVCVTPYLPKIFVLTLLSHLRQSLPRNQVNYDYCVNNRGKSHTP